MALFYYWYIRMEKASFVFIDEFDAFYHFELSESVQRRNCDRHTIFRKCIRQVHLMADKDYKVFIVEGEVRESQIIDNISKFSLMGSRF